LSDLLRLTFNEDNRIIHTERLFYIAHLEGLIMARAAKAPGKSSTTVTQKGADERSRALEIALGQIEKQFGKGAAMKLGERPDMTVDAIPTGALSLDIALGIGGVPRGRIVEIYGPEASGKTTVALHIVAEAQKGGGTAAFIDAEHAWILPMPAASESTSTI
jgi:predicted ATP-dependent serine protease